MTRIHLTLATLVFSIATTVQALPKEVGLLDAWVWQVIGAKGKHPRSKSIKQALYAWDTQGKLQEFQGSIQAYKAYSVVNSDGADWSQGHNMFYVGVRKKGFRASGFLTRVASHVKMIRDAFTKSKVLRRYIVFATDDYEVALMNWASKKEMDQGFQTPEGKKAGADSQEIMEQILWTDAPLKDLTP